ncbi:hypothetical protein NHP200010_09780 [Helicobacter bizzozeronii]|uniref:hypothetical protein n=1 Tax=Helicobacter bizzozeronii TaxID=56877 RepID=UPI00244D83FE|nr:hypothetical protein [Helicobacter bizzozeronii]GMB93264.1 hypothetical protein NHP200010_09780 [Helicobacter bizzozeronii]
MQYRVLVNTQIWGEDYQAGDLLTIPTQSTPDYLEYLRVSKVIEPLPTQEDSYPCVDYRDEIYLCGGKRLVKDRYKHEES